MKLKAYHGIGNLDDFYSGLQNFDTKTYYNNTPHNVKKCIKAVKKNMQKSIISISEKYSHTIHVIIFSIHTCINVFVFQFFHNHDYFQTYCNNRRNAFHFTCYT